MARGGERISAYRSRANLALAGRQRKWPESATRPAFPSLGENHVLDVRQATVLQGRTVHVSGTVVRFGRQACSDEPRRRVAADSGNAATCHKGWLGSGTVAQSCWAHEALILSLFAPLTGLR